MGIGLGIVLLVLGLIFALDVVDLPGAVDNAIDTNTLGWILIIAGVLIVLFSIEHVIALARGTEVEPAWN